MAQQKGVFRVNCLDSIDRTNVAITQIGITMFQKLLRINEVKIGEVLGKDVEKHGIAFSTIDHPLINEYKFQWRDKGDFLSR